ncbi:hypothetical protein CVT25_009227 [Psilocybe cyanescens]|uniref:Uncharacterized protein n=1 Tax=Psilocybe cyanescens TaxID=93625 RepID=A0A409WWB7_PSICY|nr:hypothetical protein CVT25_009227 [Psilocybe cyanescens]
MSSPGLWPSGRGAEEPREGVELGGLMGPMGKAGDVLVRGHANLPSFLAFSPPVRAPPLDIAQPPPPLPPPSLPANNLPAAAPAAAGSSGAGSSTVPVVVSASMLTDVAAKVKAKDGATDGAGSSTSLPPAVKTSDSASTQLTITASASDNNNAARAPALPADIIQGL